MRSASIHCLVACIVLCFGWSVQAQGTSRALVLRVFLSDGSSVVSFGEFTSVGPRVLFSTPVGGSDEQPVLHLVSVPAASVDWIRTDRYTMAARTRWYADTRGPEEFEQLSSEVAQVLNDVASSRDRRQGLVIAENARRILSDWPRTHFGYRQADVVEVVSLLDEAISDLRSSLGMSSFDLAFVAGPIPETSLEPLLGPPTATEQIGQLFRLADLSERAVDRVGLLQAALSRLNDAGASVADSQARRWRQDAELRIRRERELDTNYADVSRRLLNTTTRAAASGNIADIEHAVADLRKQDERLGWTRPELVDSLHATFEVQLDAARAVRLQRAQLLARQNHHREYRRAAGPQLRQLSRLQPPLLAIRRLQAPSTRTIRDLRKRLEGGVDALQRIGERVPDDLRETHGLFVSAWRFAERAVTARAEATSTGSLAVAWEASSAAAGALLMLERAEHDLALLIEPPLLQ